MSISIYAALLLMFLTFAFMTGSAIVMHENIHSLIFRYFGVKSEVSVNLASMSGLTTPNAPYANGEVAMFANLAHSLNEIAYIFVLPLNIFVSFMVFGVSYFVMAHVEKQGA